MFVASPIPYRIQLGKTEPDCSATAIRGGYTPTMLDAERLVELQTERDTWLGYLASFNAELWSVAESKKAAYAVKISAAKQHIADIDAIITAIEAGILAAGLGTG